MIDAPRARLGAYSILAAAIGLAGCDNGSGGAGGNGGTGGSEVPLRILVINDDGVDAEGIDAVVQALIQNPMNAVIVSAPDQQRSGSGDMTGCGTGAGVPSSTDSGYDEDVWEVDGCPADAVNFALDPANGLYEADALPHVVISGTNEGQNISEPIQTGVSGTVGGAKTAARDHDIPALATSTGSSTGLPGGDAVFDYEAGADAVLEWLAEHRSVLAAGTVGTDTVDSINTPTCTAGEIRGLREVPMAPTLDDAFKPQDCESTLQDPATDAEAFNNGFNALSKVPAN